MSAALRLVDLARMNAVTMSPAAMTTTSRPTARPTLMPEMVPTDRPVSTLTLRVTELPCTVRSATVVPRTAAAERLEGKDMLAAMRLNVAYVESLLGDIVAPSALEALADLHEGIDRLERRFAPAPPVRLGRAR